MWLALSLVALSSQLSAPDGAVRPKDVAFDAARWLAPPPLPSFHRSDENLANLPAPQADLQIPDLVYTDQVDGVSWARTRQYKVQASGEEFTYYPFLGAKAERHWPISWRLSGVQIGGDELPLADGQLVHSAEKFVQDHGAVDVVYDLYSTHVAQSIVVDLAGRSGTTIVEFELTTELATSLSKGELTFDHERGGVHVSRPLAIEADGTSSPIPVTLVGNTLRMEVDASVVSRCGSTLVIDPFLSTFVVDGVTSPQYEPDVAYCYATDTFTYVYTDGFTNGDYDTYLTRVDSAGAFVGGAYIDLTTEQWREPKIASAQFHSKQLVVALRRVSTSSGSFEVVGRLLTTTPTGQTLDPVIVIGDVSSTWTNLFADVGGSQRNAADAKFFVCWSREFSSGPIQARHKTVSATGTQSTLLTTLPSATLQRRVAVSKSTGDTTSGNRWNVAVESVTSAGPLFDGVVGMQFDPNGDRVMGSSLERRGPGSNPPGDPSLMDVSDGILVAGNSEPTYMIAWEKRAGLVGTFVRYDTLIAEQPLFAWSQHKRLSRPRNDKVQLSTTRERFLVTSAPHTRVQRQHRWAQISVFDLTDHDRVVPSEAMVEFDSCFNLFNDVDGFPAPLALSSRFSGGFLTSRYAHLGWTKYCPGVTTERDVSGALFFASTEPGVGRTFRCGNNTNGSGRAALALLRGDRSTTGTKSLELSFLPSNGLGMAFTGPAPAINNPAFGNGLLRAFPLCFRSIGSTGIPFTADASGSASLPFDPTTLPHGLGGTSAMVGETWGFQVVYSDTTSPGTPMRMSNVVYLEF